MNKTEKEYISIREFARRINVNEKTIRKAIQSEKIINGVYTKDGKPCIVFDEAIKDAEANGIGNKSHNKKNDEPVFTEAEKAAFPNQTVNTVTYNESRRREMYYKSEKARLDVEEKAGTLVNREMQNEKLYAAARTIRNSLLQIPDKLTDQLIALSNDRSAFRLLLYNSISEQMEKLCEIPDKPKTND